MTARRGVLFDVDGTLIDSNYLHVIAWARAFRDAGERIDMWRIHRVVGMGADHVLQELFGEERPDLDEGYSRHFAPLKDELAPFDRAAELVQAVAARGLVTVLATSSKPEDVEQLVEKLGAGDALHEVVHSGDVDRSKPSPDIFAAALEKGRLDAAHAVVLGDTVWDVEAAHGCGLPAVGVLSGGISKAELEDAGAVAVYLDCADVLDHLDEALVDRL